ncbi:hypothetical protein D9M71_417700 [compost metagenome]
MIELAAPQFTEELLHQLHRALMVLIVRYRREEIPRIGQAVAADRSQVRNTHGCAMVLGDVAAGLAV